MPPPPVAGAAVENGLGVGLAVGVGVMVGLADGVDVGLTLAVGVGTLAVRLGALVGVADPVPPGEIGGGDAVDGDPEQAETAVEANMAKAAQPTTVNLALGPVRFITGNQATRSARPGEDARPPQLFAVPARRAA